MPGTWFRDEDSGKAVLVERGLVQLRDAQGNVFEVAPDGLPSALARGMAPADERDISAYEQRKSFGAEVAGAAKTAGKAAVAGAIDVATAPITAPAALGAALAGERSPLEFARGRNVLENVAAIGGELGGGESEVAAREYAEETRREAARHPLAAFGGRMVGEVAGAIATGGASAATGSLARTVGIEASLGAASGVQQTAEDAYLADAPMSADAALANAGLGAILSGGVAFGLSRAGRVFSRSGSRGASTLDAPTGGAAYRAAVDAIEEEGSRVLGHPVSRDFGKKFLAVVNDLYSPAAAAVSGAEAKGVRKFGALSQAVDPEARRAIDMVRKSDEILEGSAAALTGNLDDLEKSSRDIFEVWSRLDLKREHIRAKLKGDEAAMIAAAREEAAALRGDFAELAGGAYGNKKLVRNTQAFVEDLGRRIDATDDAAEAFALLDRAKRGLQRERVFLGRGASRQADALKLQQAEALGARLEQIQERTRQLLMTSEIWGDAADIQRSVNGAWEKFFESNRLYNRNFLTATSETFQGRPIMRANPAAVSRYVRTLGRAEGKLVDEQLRHHVGAIKGLAQAIGEGFELGERAASVAAIRDAADNIGKTLSRADETVRFVNEFDEMLKAEKAGASALLGPGGGFLAGGPLGAVAGLAVGALARPAHTALQFAGLRAMTRHVTRQMDRSTGRFFDGFDALRMPRSLRPAPSAQTTRRAMSIVATGFATRDESKREAYARHARDIRSQAANPALVHARLASSLREVAADAPKFTTQVTVGVSRGLQFLASKLPTPGMDPASYTPHLSESMPPDDEIAEFERYWQGVTNPVGAIRQLESGMFTLEHAEALRAVYPSLYAELQLMVMRRLTELKKPPPYAARAQLDTVLGLGGKAEPSLEPGALARRMALAEAQQAPPVPPPSGRVPDLASKARTKDQELQEAFG